MVKSTFLAPAGTAKGDGRGGIEWVGVVGSKGKGRRRGCLAGYGGGWGALVDKDGDAAIAACGTRSQHDQIGVAIAVDIAGERLIAFAGQGIVAFEDGCAVALAEPYHQYRTDGRVTRDHRHIEDAHRR